MSTTPYIGITEISESQAQKALQVNEALRRIEAVVQPTVLGYQSTPPTAPADGNRYLVGAGPTGAWVANAQKIAYYINGGWAFITATKGWIYFRNGGDGLGYRFTGTVWAIYGGPNSIGANSVMTTSDGGSPPTFEVQFDAAGNTMCELTGD